MTFPKVESYYHYCSELIFHTADNFEIRHKDIVIYRRSLDHYLNNHPVNTFVEWFFVTYLEKYYMR